ncbi:transglycosylase domain-containing protein [Jeotgalibacillus campisalis]|uniref:Peptidoglycan glycosyltransferase n=1 Tax=Jeotgalibacillus campisalis TaxID=220754 RepID=A0A0C2VBM5_9BACL|nr:transglycosylase domain-containing protein [Jeotgalibacillus campisalis]KIL46352.1 peptidoglycan glycosyltransferase [Jeotgalibacillus campisalis]
MADRKLPFKERIDSIKSAFVKAGAAKKFRISYQVLWNIFLLLIIFGVLGAAFAGGVGAGYFASLVKDEKVLSYESLQTDLYDYTETSDIYFDNEVYLGKIRTDLEREKVVLDDVSPLLIDAVISTEDEYFMQHDGVVPKAIMRALFQEVTNSANQTGGSTLTQQLIKNQVLTNEVSFDRKAKEILLALRVERFFEKEEILQAYLNMADMGRNSSGNNIAGVQTAAQGIFGVDAKDLTLPQAAFIAGLPQAPYGYTPFTNAGELKSPEGLQPGVERKQEVLFRMLREGSITQEEHDEALNYDLTQDFIPPAASAVDQYPYVTREVEDRAVDILKYYLAEQDGYPKKQVDDSKQLSDEYKAIAKRDLGQRGYEIHSTIDKEIYDTMEIAKNQYENYGPNKTVMDIDDETGKSVEVSAPVQVGSILMENHTGKIISFTGGRDFEQEQTNHATRSYRSTGSTIKPLVVYAPAVEYGLIGAASPVVDVSFTHNGWSPVNFVTGKEYGILPARTALAKSHNLSAARLFGKMLADGYDPGEFLRKTNPERISEAEYSYPAFSLGGLDHGLTVEENVSAYAALGNMGQFNEPYMIEKILDQEGNVIYEHETEPEEIFSPAASYVTLDMMRDTMINGSGVAAPQTLNFSTDWASKSGTSSEFHDNWFIGTNPNITFGIWFGYDQPSSMGSEASRRAITLWAQMMNNAREVNPDLIDPSDKFARPDGVVNQSICSFTGLPADSACSAAGLTIDTIATEAFNPSGENEGLSTSKYVTINGKRYVALDSTPDEFSSTGALLSPNFAEKMLEPYGGDASKLFPDTNDYFDNLLVADSRLEDDGSNPGTVTARVSGNSVTWTPSGSSDVVGYRVYSGSRKVAIRKVDESLTSSLSAGTYEVVAVDVAGKESARSNEVRIGAAPPPESEEADETEQTEESQDTQATATPPASTPPSGGNGSSNDEDEDVEEPEEPVESPDPPEDEEPEDPPEEEDPPAEDPPEDDTEEEEETSSDSREESPDDDNSSDSSDDNTTDEEE